MAAEHLLEVALLKNILVQEHARRSGRSAAKKFTTK
jgi:hypothetical protein